MKLKQVLVIAIIAMFLLVPFASAKQEVADSVKQDKKIDEKITDKTKESAKEIKNKDKDITGKITVTDSDTSSYEVSKESDTAIKIKKNEAGGEHTKAKVTIPKEELQKIDEDGDKLYGVLHIADDGTATHDIVTESELVAGTEMTFSENIVNGYTGHYEKTQTGVTSGTTIDIPDVSGSDYYVTVSVDGTVPEYTAWNENDINTYPSKTNIIAAYPLDTNANDISGNARHGTGTNISYNSNYAVFNGKADITLPESVKVNTTNYSLVTKIYSTSPSNYISRLYISGYSSSLYTGILYSLDSTGSTKLIAGNTTAPMFSKNGNVYQNNTPTSLVISKSTAACYMYKGGASPLTYDIFGDSIRFGIGNSVLGKPTAGFTNSFYGRMYYFIIYSKGLSAADAAYFYAGGSGISMRPSPSFNFTPYNVASNTEKIIDTDSTCTGIEYIDTVGGTHTVTVRIYFTEDITKTTETKGAVYQNVSITHMKQNVTASVGTIAYELDPLYSGTPVLSSNNINATVSRNDTHVLISTGLVKQGQSFSYAVSVPDSHEHGIHLGNLMKWVGTGWDFVSTAPEDWTNYIGDEIEVTVS